jgi:[ribosomal protein S5]-alanine N-acetyltransferase
MVSFLRTTPSWDGLGRLNGLRVYLRPPAQRDYEAWASLRRASQHFLQPWEPSWSDDELSREAWRRRLKAYGEVIRAGIGAPHLIFRHDDDTLLGGINLNNIQRGIAQYASVGYWIGHPYAQRGYMHDALRTVLAHAFASLRLHRVEANCLPSNHASRALLAKTGFSLEGQSRAFLKINGAWEDHLRYAILEGDPIL